MRLLDLNIMCFYTLVNVKFNTHFMGGQACLIVVIFCRGFLFQSLLSIYQAAAISKPWVTENWGSGLPYCSYLAADLAQICTDLLFGL